MGAPDGHTIVVAETADTALQRAVARLLPQLSASSTPPDLETLRRMLEDPATTLLLAVADGPEGSGRVVGMLTLVTFMLPTGLRAWIDDVVVDDASRGAGVAGALVRTALERAGQLGARTVDLTSRPEREAANRLYVRLGFAPRATNVYRFTLQP